MSLQEAGLQLPLRHRTHSIERTPDDSLSPKSLVEQAQAATTLETPTQDPFMTFSSACKQPSASAQHRAICLLRSSTHNMLDPALCIHVSSCTIVQKALTCAMLIAQHIFCLVTTSHEETPRALHPYQTCRTVPWICSA